jgi:predicted porin
MKKLSKIAAITLVALGAMTAQAQSVNNVTIYGSIDEYLNYLTSSSGASIRSLQDGAYARSRLGLKGLEDLGAGLSAKFQMEHSFTADTGAQNDGTRFWDRQAWVGLASTQWGELRLGRQNSAIQARGDYIDFTSRTLGSMVNSFGVPSRYDNDVSWMSPRWQGLMLEAHFATAEDAARGTGSQSIYQFAADYLAAPFRVGYAGIRAKAKSDASNKQIIGYDNLYANYDYGQGKVYLAYVRSNNVTSSANGNTAGQLLGLTGSLVTGASADGDRYYNIWQLSGDYKITPKWRVGGLWGYVADASHSGHGAKGGVVGTYYDLSVRTTLYGMHEVLMNSANAGFRLVGSAGLNPNFTGDDVNGRTMRGIQLGIVHRF